MQPDEWPVGESMQQTLARLEPYWRETIQPEIRLGKRILIVSHKNTLRTLMMLLDQLTSRQVMKLTMATGRPLVYELDAQLAPLKHYYLGDPEAAARAAAAVANQGKS